MMNSVCVRALCLKDAVQISVINKCFKLVTVIIFLIILSS